MIKAIKNFFLVNRALLFSDRWLREPFTRGQAWVDLFGLAQHSDGYLMIRGVRVDLKRGQLGYSQLALAKRWKWSRDKVRRHLRRLETAGDIIQQNTQVTTIITIVKYDTWQGEPDASIQQTIQQTIQQKNNRKTTNDTHTNNGNNEKKKKNNLYSPNSDEFLLSELLLKLILERKSDYKKPNLQTWAGHIDKTIRLDQRTPARIRQVIQWCQTDGFWMNNILSTEKLRKQFDKLELRMAQNGQNERDYGNQQSSIGTTIDV